MCSNLKFNNNIGQCNVSNQSVTSCGCSNIYSNCINSILPCTVPTPPTPFTTPTTTPTTIINNNSLSSCDITTIILGIFLFLLLIILIILLILYCRVRNQSSRKYPSLIG